MQLDVGNVKRAEKELDSFINSRSKGREDANRQANEVAAAERARLQRRREQNKQAWIAHYMNLSDSHANLAQDYEERAMKLLGIKKEEQA